MPTYDYRCGDCGEFSLLLPLGAADPACPCRTCGGPARRVWSAPAVTSSSSTMRRLRDAAERSASAPDVIVRTSPARSEPVRRFGKDQQALPRP